MFLLVKFQEKLAPLALADLGLLLDSEGRKKACRTEKFIHNEKENENAHYFELTPPGRVLISLDVNCFLICQRLKLKFSMCLVFRWIHSYFCLQQNFKFATKLKLLIIRCKELESF